MFVRFNTYYVQTNSEMITPELKHVQIHTRPFRKGNIYWLFMRSQKHYLFSLVSLTVTLSLGFTGMENGD